MKPRAVTSVLALLPLLLLWPALRHAIESRMATHMLLEFPLLAAAGAAVAMRCWRRPSARRWLRWQRALDWRGWTSATVASSVALVWMLPSALDAALLWPAAAAGKYASWWLAGWLLADGWRRMDAELLLFAVGNLGWMAATAGLLYLDAPARLCVNYLQDDQRHTGIGLIALAALAGALVLRRVAVPVERSQSPRASAAASDIIERSQGGSNTTSTVASPTSGRASSLSQASSAMDSPMPQPGAVSVMVTCTRKPPSSIGSSSQP